MTILGLGKKKMLGEGIITLKSWQEGDKIVTQATSDYKNINTEGAILELEKIINKLKEDLKK